ncbi:RHS repeat-associated core domain-containing protein [Pseudomonas fluorescens]|uniref:RHS repeat-associated core domain-containing protein n=1 Tax=Pseudomonas fluorescens TaxID=294 RepID=UPI0020C4CE64|nr:RHS repeat-associated core domain-containing protein [Pseudomonas fluorescens]UTL93504.1 RHS repeat-associated core domain-containing protein [Pseudomonas fluorescens]
MKTRNFYSGNNLLAVITGSESVRVFQFEDLLFSESRAGALPECHLLSTDEKKSVMQTRGATPYTVYGYDEWHKRSTLLGFNGQTRDGVTGCDFLGMGKRAYSSVLMRFVSPDGFSPFDIGGINAYAYCKGDPVNYVDPSGNSPGRPSVIVQNPQARVNKYWSVVRKNLKQIAEQGRLKRTGSPIEQLHVRPKRMRDSPSTIPAAVVDVVKDMQGKWGDSAGKEADNMIGYLTERVAAYDRKSRAGAPLKLTEGEKIVSLAIGEGLMFGGSRTYYYGAKNMHPHLSKVNINSLAYRMRVYANSVRKFEGLE